MEFYLTPSECEDATRWHEAAKKKMAPAAWYVARSHPFTPNPEMNDSHYLPE